MFTLVFLGAMMLFEVGSEFITGVLAIAMVFANNMGVVVGYHFGGSERGE